MSWAMRRRILYAVGVFLFFFIIIGVPLFYKLSTVPPSCTDGVLNQGESAPDRGGPCPLADTNKLAPSSVLWTRAFKIRDGSYSAVTYIQNSNDHAGIINAPFKVSLYDAQNILVAEVSGYVSVIPGGITPVYVPDIDTGNRIASHAFFQFAATPRWLQLEDTSKALVIGNKKVSGESTSPRIEATVTNTDVAPRKDVSFSAVVFDTAGNAFAASATHVDRIDPGESVQIVFTWPSPFTLQVGRVDILPIIAPAQAWSAPCHIVNGTSIQC